MVKAIAAECVGHMVGLAGDFVGEPSLLHIQTSRNPRYLVSRKIDCFGFFERAFAPRCSDPNMGLEENRSYCRFEFEEDRSRLFRWRPAQYLEIIDLLTSNTQHFVPKSFQEWQAEFERTLKIDVSDESMASLFAQHAFAVHFLQDSFSAGHNGVRREDLRQDYDNGYHDTLNHTGAFLENDSGHIWHSYGDRRSEELSYYIRFEEGFFPEDDEENDDKIKILVEGLCQSVDKTCTPPGKRFADELKRIATEQGSKTHYVLSLDRLLSAFRPCAVLDSCNKSEFVLLGPENLEEAITDCKEKPADGVEGVVLYECDSTRRHVGEATTASMIAFLMYIGGQSNESVLKKAHRVREMFPRYYYPLRGSSINASVLNSTPLILSYGSDRVDQTAAGSEDLRPSLSYGLFGFALNRKTDIFEDLAEEALSLQTIGRPLCIKQELERDDEFIDLDQVPNRGVNRLENCPSLNMKVELIDSSGDVFDAIDFSFVKPIGTRFPSGSGSRFANIFGV
jgi:hypothetical protein